MLLPSSMQPLAARRWASWRLSLWAACVLACCALAARASADEPAALDSEWRFDRADGTQVVGALNALDARNIVVATPEGVVTFAADDVRGLGPVEKPAVPEFEARIWMTDGSLLAGNGLTLEGRDLALDQEGARLVLPQGAVAKIAWNLSGAETVGPSAPAWHAAVPADVDSDLIVIQKSADPEPVFQCVPCAILSIDEEHVTVALDEDRIPVKRDRVAGLVWLRAESDVSLQGPVVELAAGRVLTRDVRFVADTNSLEMMTAWSAGLRVPVAAVRRIDLAAGRTISLTTLVPDESTVEPAFAGLGQVEALAAAFEPRMLSSGEVLPNGLEGPMILAMPRTVLRWKLPAGVRQLRMTVVGERLAGGGADLVVVVDGNERLRRGVASDGGAGDAIDVDVSGGRSLEVHIDFPNGVSGRLAGLGRIRLIDPRLEK
jgi:hypothetical protein